MWAPPAAAAARRSSWIASWPCLSAQTNFSFVVDGRFKGGYITRRYGDPARRIEAVQLEIAQCAYLTEARAPSFDAARAQPLSSLLRELLGKLAGRITA